MGNEIKLCRCFPVPLRRTCPQWNHPDLSDCPTKGVSRGHLLHGARNFNLSFSITFRLEKSHLKRAAVLKWYYIILSKSKSKLSTSNVECTLHKLSYEPKLP
jgi:hypothetical protein